MKRFVRTLGLAEPTDRDQKSKSQVKKGGSKSQVRGTKVSPDISLRSNDFVVRIVHKGGSLEVYEHALPVSMLLAKYPGMCVALPGVFRDPHRSVLKPEEVLLLGHKYLIISSRDVDKLKRKYPLQGKAEEPNGLVSQEPLLESNIARSPSGHKHKENGELSVPNGDHGQKVVESRTRLSPNGCKVLESSKVQEGNEIEEGKEDAKMNMVPGGGDAEDSYGYAKDYYSVPKDKFTRHARQKGIKGKKRFVPPLPKTRPYRGLGWQPRLPTVPELSP